MPFTTRTGVPVTTGSGGAAAGLLGAGAGGAPAVSAGADGFGGAGGVGGGVVTPGLAEGGGEVAPAVAEGGGDAGACTTPPGAGAATGGGAIRHGAAYRVTRAPTNGTSTPTTHQDHRGGGPGATVVPGPGPTGGSSSTDMS
ncbi:hypothetical protein ACWGG3_41820, partial [Streptomyces sp. NPDC054901]